MNNSDLPLSFVMNLAQNETALKNFEAMSEQEKKDIISKTHSVTSRTEMKSLVNSLSNENPASGSQSFS